MSATNRTRLVGNNQTIIDQADFYESDGFTRILGLPVSALTLRVFFQNEIQPWPLSSGVGIPDTQVAAGRIYWSEIAGSPGFYSVRWRPNAVGFWRVVVSYPSGSQSVSLEYDVVRASNEPTGGLKPSFMNPSC